MASATFLASVGGDGSTVSDDSNPTTGLANGGHRTRFVPALAQTVAVAARAVASAESALNAPGTSATSTTGIDIGTGSKTLTIQTGKAFSIGQYVVVASTIAPANYVAGQITAHDSSTGTLTINATETGGSGTLSLWTVALSAPGGVTLNGTQTLTNKTLQAPNIINGLTIAGAAGTAGQVLTSAGPGAAPAWSTLGASALTLVSSVTATNGASSIDLTSGFTSAYNVYMLVGSGLVCTANQGSVDVTVNIDGSWLSAGYAYYASALSSNLGDFGGNSNSGSKFIFSSDWGGGSSSGTLDFVMYIYNPANTSLWKNFSWEGTVISYSAGSNYPVSFRGGGSQKNAAALTGVRITPGTRTMVSGVMRLYGIANS